MMKHEAKFYENKGQWDHRGQFLTRRPGMDVWFEDRGIDFDYYNSSGNRLATSRKGQVVSMQFDGAGSKLKFQGVKVTGSRNDYLISKKWVRQAMGYSEVKSADVFPGTDFRGYYEGDKPRYDFIVHPHSDPSAIRLKYVGAQHVAVTKNGVEFKTQVGTRVQGDLHVYQLVNGHRVAVPASFTLLAKNKVGLKVGTYDKSKDLVVDPLVYGTYYGGNQGWDEVRSVVADNSNTGGVYLTGDTQSTNFPVIYGPYFLNLKGTQNAYLAKLQGDAFNQDYAAFFGGSVVDSGQFLKLDPFGNIVVVGTSNSSDMFGSSRLNKLLLSGDGTIAPPEEGGLGPVGHGQFVLTDGASITGAIPFNATAANVTSAIKGSGTKANPGLAFQGSQLVAVKTLNNLPINDGGKLEVDFPNGDPGVVIQTIDTRLPVPPSLQQPNIPGDILGDEISSGLDFTIVDYYTDKTMAAQVLIPEGPPAPNNPVEQANEAFTLTVTTFNADGSTNQQTTKPLPVTSNAAQIQAALVALSNVGTGNVTVTDSGAGQTGAGQTGTIATDSMGVLFGGKLPAVEQPIIVTDVSLAPKWNYNVTAQPFVFSMAFKSDPNTILKPIIKNGGTAATNTALQTFGSAYGTVLNGFDIKQVANPVVGSSDDIVLSGTTVTQIPEFTAINYVVPNTSMTVPTFFARDFAELQTAGFMFRMSFSPTTGAFSLVNSGSTYMASAQFDVNNRGVVLDSGGNAYVCGTVGASGGGNTQTDTTGLNGFYTTPGVFANLGTEAQNPSGRLLQEKDIYVQKYPAPSSSITKVLPTWSGLLGGHADDIAGGFFWNMDGSDLGTGSAIAIDSANSVYVVGEATSFDFPRTRGVYGEVFTDSRAVTVTKLTTDGSTITYSTNLNGSGWSIPAGISVDVRGDAVVSGNIACIEEFPEDIPGDTIPSPDQPASNIYGTAQTTSDAFLTTNPASPTAPEIGVTQSWVNVLNPDATGLIFGSYLGGTLNNLVYGPYVDAFGDAWLFGYIQTYRIYSLPGLTTPYQHHANLPASMLSPDAFKPDPDSNGNAATSNPAIPFHFFDDFGGQQVAPSFVSDAELRDGWVLKMRVGLPSVQSLTFSPATVPGGFGSTSTGTVTLTGAAPSNGALVNITIVSGSGASFSSSSQVGTTSITIPAGSTTGTFTVFTSPVNAVTPVTIQANYLGTFQDAALNVVPYLGGLSLSPTTVVGGNGFTATITLVQPAPTTGGVSVNLSTPNTSTISFPNGSVVTVPAGQTTASIQLNSVGVIAPTTVSVNAAISSFSLSQEATIIPASLQSLTFNPSSTADNQTVTGTVTLNGVAGSNITVTLSASGVPAGFSIPASVVIPKGQSSVNFSAVVPSSTTNFTASVTANMSANQGVSGAQYTSSTVTGNLQVTSFGVSAFTVSPATIPAGGTSTGTVSILQAAPTGGITLTVTSSNPTILSVPATVTIPSGSSSATFTMTGGAPATTTPVIVSVTRGTQVLKATVTVQPIAVSLTINPPSVFAGGTATGTVSVPFAPTTPLTIALSQVASPSGQPLGTLSASSVTIPAGSTSATFTITAGQVSKVTTLTISASYTQGTAKETTTAQLTVTPVQVASLSFSPSTVHGGVQSTQLTITLQGKALPGGAVIALSSNNPFLLLPASFTVPAGATTATFTVTTKRVSRMVSDTVTASLTGASATTPATTASATVILIP